MRGATAWWLLAGWAAFLALPFYAQEEGFWSLQWLARWTGSAAAPAALQALVGGKFWLWPLMLALIAPLPFLFAPRHRLAAPVLMLAGGIGLLWLLAQGFAIGARGFTASWLADVFGPFAGRQFGMGYGALLLAGSFLFLFTSGWAMRGALKGDGFLTGAIGLIIASTLIFVFFPVALILGNAAQLDNGGHSLTALIQRLAAPDIWRLGCVVGQGRCGVLWNTVLIAILVGLLTTALGLAFALLSERTRFPARRTLGLIAILPIITPPFVVGLALILLFGRTGAVSQGLEWALGIEPSRWIYGLPGIVMAQVLSFTPVAFLVLIGVVQGVSPAMEEAAQTLRASRLRVFMTVSLPLMRPGLANAFLVGVIESIADFGNPVVLGGNFDVLSTQIYFALVGAQSEPGRAAALGIVLLGLALAAFLAQTLWLGQRSYTTVAGKGDSGVPLAVPRPLDRAVYAATLPWMAFTLIVYGMIVFGGLVENFGRDHSFTLRHFLTNFGIEWGEHGLVWSGRAWNSLFTTLEVSVVAAPLTAAIGLLTAYLLARQRFAGRATFEFVTMLSFAIPGTVIGLAYIMAFNTPPIELTGTAMILVICFIFRDMPVAIRAGVAAMSQLDRSLDESSLTLRHGSFATIRRVILPLMRPAIVAALVFSLVRAMTSISAVIFLVSTQHNLATVYIVGRAENADYGGAISYSAVLVLVMAGLIALIQWAVGERKLGRRALGHLGVAA